MIVASKLGIFLIKSMKGISYFSWFNISSEFTLILFCVNLFQDKIVGKVVGLF
jgi:hypothetical protein